MSILFFLSQTTSLPRLKYQILYSLISEPYSSENGISSTPSSLSRKPTLKSSALMLGSQVILSMMFLAVRSFSFLWCRTASLSLWGGRSLVAETTRRRASSTEEADHTGLLQTSFHSSLLLFYQMQFTRVVPFLRLERTVQGPVSAVTWQSAGSFTLMGLVTSLEGLVARAPSEARPQPCRTQASGFYMLLSCRRMLSFCCILTLLMPNTSSIYFLSISSRIFPVTFSCWKILTKSQKPSLCANLTTSSVVHWLDTSWVRSQARKWARPPCILTILRPASSAKGATEAVFRLSSQSASLKRKQAAAFPTAMPPQAGKDSSWKDSSASLNLSSGSCWSKMRRVRRSGCSRARATKCLKPTKRSSMCPLNLSSSG